MAICHYYINGLFVFVVNYYINGYSCLLLVIILMVINEYYINGY
jgi:hypothetical protein